MMATAGLPPFIDEHGAWRARPGRWAKFFNSGPTLMFRLGLGRIMPGSFVLITHRGRKSGALRRTCVEAIHRDPATGEFVVFSSRGDRADWYRNLQAAPPVEVQVRGRRFAPRQHFLSAGEVLPLLRSYVERHPRVASQLVPGGTDEEYATAAARARMVSFRE